MTDARAKIFLSVRGRYDYTVATVAGILENAGEPPVMLSQFAKLMELESSGPEPTSPP